MKSSAVCSCLGLGYLKNESNHRGADVGGGVWLGVEGVERQIQQPQFELRLGRGWARLSKLLDPSKSLHSALKS